MEFRQSGSPCVLLTLGLSLAFAGTSVLRADATRVDALLTVATELPDAARRALVEEAVAIWREAGVTITWLDSVTRHSPGTLRVMVVRRPATPGHGERWAVGELLRDGGAAIAIASISRAEEIVDAAANGRARLAPAVLRHHRLGVVLGRAVAHEIGHYLLGDGSHAGRGLMRPAFDAREFADLRSGAFAVDAGSQRIIRERLLAQSIARVLPAHR